MNFVSNNHSSTITTTTSRIFLNAAGIVEVAAFQIIDRSKKIRDKVNSRIVSTIKYYCNYANIRSNLCEISIDDGRENSLTKMTMCIVANGKYLGQGYKAAPDAISQMGYWILLF